MPFRFSLRDILFLTVIAGLVLGWYLDRATVQRRYQQSLATIERLRERLDRADPGWRGRDDDRGRPGYERLRQQDFAASPSGALGAALFAFAILIVVLIWQKRIHVALLERHRR